MAKPNPKRLVIDASIARAAGETEHPTSKNCRDFLNTVEDNDHLVVMSPELNEEWKKHQSIAAAKWLRKRVSRGKWAFVEAFNQDLRDNIDRLGVTDKSRKEMLKDAHLLEAALATDKRIASLNENDRNRFRDACDRIGVIRPIVWVNPNIPREKCIEWLEQGAPADKHRQLGYRAEDD